MNMRQAGGWIVLAALLVNSPRFIQILLRVDGLSLGEYEAPMITATGIATGLVLSGGQMYIAHALPKVPKSRWRDLMVFGWVLMLVFSVMMISPFLVAGIQTQADLAKVLQGGWQWGWAIVAVTSVEIIAAIAMVAQSILPDEVPPTTQAPPEPPRKQELPDEQKADFRRKRKARDPIVYVRKKAPEQLPPPITEPHPTQPAISNLAFANLGFTQAQIEVLELKQQGMTDDEIAGRLYISRQAVGDRIRKAKQVAPKVVEKILAGSKAASK